MEKIEPIRIAQIMGKWVGGGVESVVMNYYRHIDKDKIQFDFICDYDSTNIPYEEIEKLGGKIILIPPYQKIFKYHKELKNILKNGKYKIVHSHINTLSVFPLYAAKMARVPVRIAHSHSTTNKKEIKKNMLKQILRPFCKMFATDYFACSEHAGTWMFGNKEINNGNVYILNNAIEVDKFKYNKKLRQEKRKNLGINEDTLVIGHIGRFVKQKNHNFLIDIFNEIHKKNNNSILILVGQGPLMNRIQNKVNKLGLTSSVKFLGQREDISELYQVFDVFLFPSLYEGLGMVLIEAQVSGLPCLCSTEVPSIVKVTSNFKFLDLSDKIENWNKKIFELIENYDRKDESEIFLNTNYDIKRETKKLEDKYYNNIKNNRKINVIHIVCGLKSGGVETMIYNYCSNMTPEKYNWHILYQHEPTIKNIKEFTELGFKIQRITAKRKNIFKNYIETYRYLKNNNIDVIHCHMTLMNFIPLIAAKKLKIPIRICHSHNSDVRKKNLFIKIIEYILKRLCIKNATHLVACSEEAGKYMYNKKEFKILNNAINLNNFEFNEQTRNSIRKKYNINAEKYIIGHIGRFTKQKNHSFIIDLFKKISENDDSFILVLVGDGELKPTIVEKVNNYHLDDKVIFTGIVPNINDYYSAFDLFILPSLWEGLPVALIEAQASGLYSILSTNIDNKSIVDPSKCIVENLRIDKWEKQILNNKNKTNDRKINKELFRQKKLDIKNESIKLEKIYDEGKDK